MTLDPETDAHEPQHSTSSTAHVLTELQLYGWRPYEDEPDPRPLPEGSQIAGAVADMLDAFVATLGDTRLISTNCSGVQSTSSTALWRGPSGNLTTTNRRNAASSGNRMAPR